MTIEIHMTGNLRSVANAAWISTMNQNRAESRSDEDVDRVTSFLAKNAHTSPFEAVTVSCRTDRESFYKILGSRKIPFFEFVKVSEDEDGSTFTTDLLNFYKINSFLGLDNPIWRGFCLDNKDVSEKLLMIPIYKDSSLGIEESGSDMSKDFEYSNIEVDLISVHDPGFGSSHERITWRVRCPLSISVQMLRHRTASFNMVSGRYKTIRQEFTSTSQDLIAIFEKSDLLKNDRDLREMAEEAKELYLSFMKSISDLKKSGDITNEEYKRCREYIRFILPEGRMTELYVTFYKKDFLHFLKLRNSSHTQPEHIYVAQKMKRAYALYKEDEKHIRS